MPDRQTVTFRVRGADCIDELEPLWLALFDHHHSVGDAGLPIIDRALTWPRRRRIYEDLFQSPEAFAVLAERDATPVGYAMCHLQDHPDDSWDTSDTVGIIETLSLLPSERGNGSGTALMDVAEAELQRRGASTVMTAVMEGNDRVKEFYQRRGMTPTVTYLMRLGPRES
ncbi:MAG TPA: GNAT family N-acetyltransferase [Actinomycetes bacterium]|nr:GNAT family N-acetyltransferase [Actinomycetes bacterium]